MAIKYYKLFDILNRRGIRRGDLPVSSVTLAKLSKGQSVTTDMLDRICKHLDVQPGDIMEYEED